jgi:hypothetical protein
MQDLQLSRRNLKEIAEHVDKKAINQLIFGKHPVIVISALLTGKAKLLKKQIKQ